MVKSRLLDKGAVWIEVFPEIVETNSRGRTIRLPSTVGVMCRATISKDRSQTAVLQGQIAIEVMRVVVRKAPVGPWSRVRIGEEDYDLTAPPHFTPGASKATAHAEFTIRSRSELGTPRG